MGWKFTNIHIINGKKTHPLNIHFSEVHQGQQQEVLLRVIKKAQTALSRQVWESVLIDSQPDPSLCLNLKSEWGGSRDPTLVHKVPTDRPGRHQGNTGLPQTNLRGTKRMQTQHTDSKTDSETQQTRDRTDQTETVRKAYLVKWEFNSPIIFVYKPQGKRAAFFVP